MENIARPAPFDGPEWEGWRVVETKWATMMAWRDLNADRSIVAAKKANADAIRLSIDDDLRDDSVSICEHRDARAALGTANALAELCGGWKE